MRRSILSVALLLGSVGTAGFLNAQTPPQRHIKSVVAKLTAKVDSRTAKMHDRIEAKLLTDWVVGGTTIPKGSLLQGEVTDVRADSVNLALTQYQKKHEPASPMKILVLMVSGPQHMTRPMPPLMVTDIHMGRVGNVAVANDAQDRLYDRDDNTHYDPYGFSGTITLKGVEKVRRWMDGEATVRGKAGFKIPKGSWVWIGTNG